MFQNTRLILLAACAFPVFGCAGTPGARPHDMSEAAHENAAESHETMAAGHSEQYKPEATETKKQCTPAERICWTSQQNPSAEHKDDAEKHRKMAADHRAAAQALRDAEASSCAGIPDEDRDMSPFNHRDDISEVKPHVVDVRVNRQTVKKTTGADVVFKAVPGMTAEWLQRIVDCHLARASAAGHDMPEMTYCPLVLKDVTAKVSSTGNGFAVEMSSENADTAKEILRRSEALVGK